MAMGGERTEIKEWLSHGENTSFFFFFRTLVLIKQRMECQIKQWLRFKMDKNKSILHDLTKNRKQRFCDFQ